MCSKNEYGKPLGGQTAQKKFNLWSTQNAHKYQKYVPLVQAFWSV